MPSTAIQPGVTEPLHPYGGVAFAPGERDLGPLHGPRIADLPFPPAPSVTS